MGAIIAGILRPVFIWIVQQGATLAVFAVLEKVFDILQEWVRDAAGISDDDSKAIMLNYAVDALLYIGSGALLIKTKIPTTLARKIGLSGSSPAKVAVSKTATDKVAGVSGLTVAKTGSSIFKKLAIVAGGISGLVWLINVPAQIVEPGIYKSKQANDVWEKFIGIRPFPETSELDSPGPFKAAEFEDYARGLETAGIKGLEYPEGSFLYSREQLARLVDYVYGVESAKGNQPTVAKIKPLVAPYLLGVGKTTGTTTTTSSAVTPKVSTTTPKVQVFTGVLSQGVLGKGLEFQARPDDLIENADELVQAAGNNLAPFLSSLFGRVSYQVRVVNSVTTKDGFTQKGSVVQVVSGYNTNGTPKYRTVVNKFAVLDIYILNDKQSRVKLTTITLGPVDSVKFQIQQGTLSYIDSTLQKQVTTTSIEAIKGVETISPVTITTPQNQVIQQPTNQSQLTPQANPSPYEEFDTVYAYRNNLKVVYNTYYGRWGVRGGANAIFFAQKDQAYQYAGIQTVPENPTPATTPPPAVGTVVAPTAPTITTPTPAPVVKPGANATNLNEWYIANGQTLPSLQARSVLYENYGLGKAAFYTGTAEQNTKLLNKLKGL